MAVAVFLDTNVVIYAMRIHSADQQERRKGLIARQIIEDHECHISVQTLNEATNVWRRKTSFSLEVIADLVADIRSFVTIHEVTEAVFARGFAIIQRYGLQTYDAMILACAIENGLETVLSEDMQHGLNIFDMATIKNPFT